MTSAKIVMFVAATVVVACGPSNRDTGGTDGNNGSGSGSGSGSANGCSDSAKSVYVVDQNNKFSQFDPATKAFHDIGQLNCPAQFLATPFSMGVDRNATAWVLYSSGELFRVDTTSLACTKTTWASSNGLMQFGMGFSTDQVAGTTDSLFVAGGSMTTTATSKLAKLDTTSLSAATVGTVTGWPELTGNSNAELWGFFPDASAPNIEQINKINGSAISRFPLAALAGTPMAWAFAFWGGDYWIFLMRSTESSTTVYQVSATGTIKGQTTASGRRIVGAGVSTCAPVVIL